MSTMKNFPQNGNWLVGCQVLCGEEMKQRCWTYWSGPQGLELQLYTW